MSDNGNKYAQPPSDTKPLILIIDDHDEIARMLFWAIRIEDKYDVEIYSGKITLDGALAKFYQSAPDLILCDTNWGGEEGVGMGITFLETIRRFSPHSRLILMSTEDIKDVAASYNLSFCIKDAQHIDEMRQLVAELLSKSQ
jgi:CheY-like chemotaxis protein